MTRRRWSDNQHNLGPFTYAKNKYHTYELILGSGDGDEYPGCYLRMRAFGHALIVNLPPLLEPYGEKVYVTTWDDATIKRLGRDWYWNFEEREYGFSYSNDKMGRIGRGGFLQVFLGRQTYSSATTQSWSCFTPWNNWRHVRHSYYDLKGNHFWTAPARTRYVLSGEITEGEMTWMEAKEKEDSVPTRTFSFTDFDGEFLQAKTRIEERQWEFGTGWFKWLSWFRKPIIHRSLNIEFSGETGKRKGSWKGGTIGHSIDMRPGELHMDAFIRYCEEHNMTYKGVGVWLPRERNDYETGAATDSPTQLGR